MSMKVAAISGPPTMRLEHRIQRPLLCRNLPAGDAAACGFRRNESLLLRFPLSSFLFPLSSFLFPLSSSLPRMSNFLIRPIEPRDDEAVARVIRAVMPEFGAAGPGFAIHD